MAAAAFEGPAKAVETYVGAREPNKHEDKNLYDKRSV